MKRKKIVNLSTDATLLKEIQVADTFMTRLKGLMGKHKLLENEGLLIKPCNSIHTIGMKFSIDVAFIGEDNVVKYIILDMRPFKLSPIIKGSKFVIEANSETFKDKLNIGDKIEIVNY